MREFWNSRYRNLGALGRLGELGIHLSAILGDSHVLDANCRLLVFCGDNGVSEDGVSAFAGNSTAVLVTHALQGKLTINSFAKVVGCQLEVVNVAVIGDLPASDLLVDRRVASGSDNLQHGDALSEALAVSALEAGAERARAAFEDGVHLIGLGEIGIGNSTAASVLASLLLDVPAADTVGRGSGVASEVLMHKMEVVRRATDRIRAKRGSPEEWLVAAGGYEFCAIVGATLAAASQRRPVFLDGFGVSVAAAVACAMCPSVRDYLIVSHLSTEPCHRRICDYLRATPLVDLGMSLGEGTGSSLGLALGRIALSAIANKAKT